MVKPMVMPIETPMEMPMEYLFGPVLSRRLGLSMGVDLLPFKTCNLDCIYCELGRTTCLTGCRDSFVPQDKVLREIRALKYDSFDHLTFAGSGEPTLSSDIGDLIRISKDIVDTPVAVITNSTLFANEKVRKEIASADVVLPSLDAATQRTFEAINRPAPGLRIEDIIEGLRLFRKEFSGEIWLEVMLVKGVNEHEADLISKAASSIDPDRIQLNTVIRPPAEPVSPLNEEEMKRMLEIFEGAELIPDWDWHIPLKTESRLLDLLSLRPHSLEEICERLSMEKKDIIKYLKILEHEDKIARRWHKNKQYFQAAV